MEAYKAAVAARQQKSSSQQLLSTAKSDSLSESSSDEEPQVAYFCELCRKVFKNENSFSNHQTSKFHLKKMVQKYSSELQSSDEEEAVEDTESGFQLSDDALESRYEKDDGSTSSEETTNFDPNELKCLFCNKDFNSLNAKESHERSKKHREAVKKAKKEMEKDDFEAGRKANDDETAAENEEFLHRFAEAVDAGAEATKSKKSASKKSKRKTNIKFVAEENGVSDTEPKDNRDPEVKVSAATGRKAKRKQKNNNSSQPVKEDALMCSVCQFEAVSRNSLFKHLKSEHRMVSNSTH